MDTVKLLKSITVFKIIAIVCIREVTEPGCLHEPIWILFSRLKKSVKNRVILALTDWIPGRCSAAGRQGS